MQDNDKPSNFLNGLGEALFMAFPNPFYPLMLFFWLLWFSGCI
jgi:hypothetical protein